MNNNILFNINHYTKVYNERKKRGLNTNHKIYIENSKYIGKTLKSYVNLKEYVVEEDWEEYCSCGNGWYKRMLLNHNGSHRVIMYENINNCDENFIKTINDEREEFGL